MPRIKVIFDVNVWFSVVGKQKLYYIFELTKENNIDIYICDELIGELYDVFHRPKKYKYLSSQVNEFFVFISERTIFRSIKHHRKFTKCSDPNDNYLFDLAIQTKAEYFVSGDDGGLDTPIPPPTKMISFSEFKEMFL
jgi:putative PIN family toxin of toxin-antitoxin system